MPSSPTSARGLDGTGGPYGLRDVRSLYPAVSENHLRYLEKWGLLRQSGRPRAEREYSFRDLLAIKQVASELEKGTPLKGILRGLLAERQGQLELDFHAAADAPKAKVVALLGRRTVPPGVTSAAPLQADASMVRDTAYQSFPFTDPQTALAAKLLHRRLPPGRWRGEKHGGGGRGLPEGARHRPRSGAGDRQSRQHPLRARRDDRSAGSRTSGRSASTRIASRPTSISATFITT